MTVMRKQYLSNCFSMVLCTYLKPTDPMLSFFGISRWKKKQAKGEESTGIDKARVQVFLSNSVLFMSYSH